MTRPSKWKDKEITWITPVVGRVNGDYCYYDRNTKDVIGINYGFAARAALTSLESEIKVLQAEVKRWKEGSDGS